MYCISIGEPLYGAKNSSERLVKLAQVTIVWRFCLEKVLTKGGEPHVKLKVGT